MSGAFLLPETELRESGAGPAFDLESIPQKGMNSFLLVTLTITHIVEQESLDLRIEGSVDGLSWSGGRLLAFPQKFYTGRYQMVMNLQSHSEIRFVRAAWVLNRWGRGDLKPFFCASVMLEAHASDLALVAAQT